MSAESPKDRSSAHLDFSSLKLALDIGPLDMGENGSVLLKAFKFLVI